MLSIFIQSHLYIVYFYYLLCLFFLSLMSIFMISHVYLDYLLCSDLRARRASDSQKSACYPIYCRNDYKADFREFLHDHEQRLCQNNSFLNVIAGLLYLD